MGCGSLAVRPTFRKFVPLVLNAGNTDPEESSVGFVPAGKREIIESSRGMDVGTVAGSNSAGTFGSSFW